MSNNNTSSHLTGLDKDRVGIFGNNPEASSLRWILVTDNDFLTCQCEKHSGPEAMLAHIRDGIETATGLAEEPPFNKGDLSKWSPSMIRKMAESVDDAGLGEDSIYEVDRRHRQEGQRMQ